MKESPRKNDSFFVSNFEKRKTNIVFCFSPTLLCDLCVLCGEKYPLHLGVTYTLSVAV